MFKKSQIPALFLLGVFLILLVHNAVPHVHHSHESTGKISLVADHDDHSHNHEHHSNEHNHHSHKNESKSQDQHNLLSFLINSHSDFFHIHEFIQFTKRDIQPSKDKVIHFFARIGSFDSLLDIERQGLYRYVLTKESWSENPFLLSCSLRAPPSIG